LPCSRCGRGAYQPRGGLGLVHIAGLVRDGRPLAHASPRHLRGCGKRRGLCVVACLPASGGCQILSLRATNTFCEWLADSDFFIEQTVTTSPEKTTMTRKRGFGARSSLPALFPKASAVTNRLGSRKEGGMPTDRLSAARKVPSRSSHHTFDNNDDVLANANSAPDCSSRRSPTAAPHPPRCPAA
jgi:hypothetical protein